MSERDVPAPSQLAKKAATELADATARVEAAIAGVDARAVFASYTLYRLSVGGSRMQEHGRPIPAAAEHAAWLLYPEFGKSSIRDGGRIQGAIDAIEAHAMALSFAEMFQMWKRRRRGINWLFTCVCTRASSAVPPIRSKLRDVSTCCCDFSRTILRSE